MISSIKTCFIKNPTFILKRIHYFSKIPSLKDEKIVSLIKTCKKKSEISQIHCFLIKNNLSDGNFKISKVLASTILIDINYASLIFKSIEKPNLFMFSTMLRGFSVNYCEKECIFLFSTMRQQNVLLDEFCFVYVLMSCSNLGHVLFGTCVHSAVIKFGIDSFVNVRNGLIRFYCVNGLVESGLKVFDEKNNVRDLVSFNTLMDGYKNACKPGKVVNLFKKLCGNGLGVNESTLLSVVLAISELNDVLLGESVHGYSVKVGLYGKTKVMTALMGMYAEFGDFCLAERVFDESLVNDVIAWNCLISKYAKYGGLEEAFELVESMKGENLKPNSSTLSGLISACVADGAISIGQRIHRYIVEEEVVIDTVLGTALVDLYCKSGLPEKAIHVFAQMKSKDVKTWTTMISGCGMNGRAKDAITFLQMMKKENVIPNGVTFLVALSACSHGGLVREGIECFESMVQDNNLTPTAEHYGCVIDLLGRAGLLDEAYRLIKGLPIKGDETAWRSLLSTCRVYGNVEMAECVTKILYEMCGEHPADTMVLSGAYAIAGRVPVDFGVSLKEEGKVTRGNDDMSGAKETGLSMIELES